MTPKAQIGDWVEIAQVVLQPEERAPGLPPDTAVLPYVLRASGVAQEAGEIGATISVRTLSGRVISGELVEINPSFRHDFGRGVPELLQTRLRLQAMMRGDGPR